MSNFKNVGELRELISKFSDDTPILGYHQDMEKSGYFQGGNLRDYRKFKLVTKRTWDRFDGIDYNYECYEQSDDGRVCLTIDF